MQDRVSSATDRLVTLNTTCSNITANQSRCQQLATHNDDVYDYDYDTSLAAVYRLITELCLVSLLALGLFYLFVMFSNCLLAERKKEGSNMSLY